MGFTVSAELLLGAWLAGFVVQVLTLWRMDRRVSSFTDALIFFVLGSGVALTVYFVVLKAVPQYMGGVVGG